MDKIGERIRRRREHLDLPMNMLAKGIGLTSSMLSQIETGKAFPSLHTIKHIADYLTTSVGALIGENDTFANNPVLSWEDKKMVKKSDNGATLYLLANYSPLQTMETYMVELEPGGSSKDLIDSRRNGQEFVFTLEGELDIELKDKRYLLENKGSIYFYSHDLKSFKNSTSGIVNILWVISPIRM